MWTRSVSIRTFKDSRLRSFFLFLALTKILLKTLEKCTREKTRLERLDEETVARNGSGKKDSRRGTTSSKERGESDGGNGTEEREAVGKLEGRRARKEVLAGRTRGARPELDRIGELVITEAGGFPGEKRRSPAGFHLIPSWLTTDSTSIFLSRSLSVYLAHLLPLFPSLTIHLC